MAEPMPNEYNPSDPDPDPAPERESTDVGAGRTGRPGDAGFLPSSPPRLAAESVLVRVVATLGVIGIGTLLGALLVANDVAGWIVGLVVAAVSVVLAAVLWRSREL